MASRLLQISDIVLRILSQESSLALTAFFVGIINSMTIKQCVQKPYISILRSVLMGTVHASVIVCISRFLPKRYRAIFPLLLVASMFFCDKKKGRNFLFFEHTQYVSSIDDEDFSLLHNLSIA